MKNDAAEGVKEVNSPGPAKEAAFQILEPEYSQHGYYKDLLPKRQKTIDEAAIIIQSVFRDSPPVNHGVVEAAQDIEELINDDLLITNEGISLWHKKDATYLRTEIAKRIKVFRDALATVTECKCGEYRKLLLQCRDADDEGEAYDMILDFFDNEEKEAALGGKEKK